MRVECVTFPIGQFIRKSWDFMPPNIVRPMASSTISDIAIISRRLVIVWKSFDPDCGSTKAEGNGHLLTSIMARSIGIVLQYTYTVRRCERKCAYIPKVAADKLEFGLVELDLQLFKPSQSGRTDIDIGSLEATSRSLLRYLAAR